MASAVNERPTRLEDVRYLALIGVGVVALRYVFVSLSHVVAHVSARKQLREGMQRRGVSGAS